MKPAHMLTDRYIEEKRLAAIEEVSDQLQDLIDYWGYDIVYYVMLYLHAKEQA